MAMENTAEMVGTTHGERALWRAARQVAAEVLDDFRRTRRLDFDAALRMDSATRDLRGIRRDRGMDLMLRVWTEFLEVHGRGRASTGIKALVDREDLALAVAELLASSIDLGSARAAYRHLLFQQLCWLKDNRALGTVPLEELDPRFGRWMARIQGKRHIQPRPTQPTPKPAPATQGPDCVRLEWQRRSREYHPSGFQPRQLRLEREAHRAGAVQMRIDVSKREMASIRRNNARYMAQHSRAMASQDEEQYLGNAGAGHWSNPRSHH